MKEYIVQAIAQETIDSFDAHNAPELVRCKGYKYGYPMTDSAFITCGRRFHDGQKHDGDWFCADGERKETT